MRLLVVPLAALLLLRVHGQDDAVDLERDLRDLRDTTTDPEEDPLMAPLHDPAHDQDDPAPLDPDLVGFAPLPRIHELIADSEHVMREEQSDVRNAIHHEQSGLDGGAVGDEGGGGGGGGDGGLEREVELLEHIAAGDPVAEEPIFNTDDFDDDWDDLMDTTNDIMRRVESNDEKVVVDVLQELSDMPLHGIRVDTIKAIGPAVNRVRRMPGMKEAAPLATVLLQKWKPLLLPVTAVAVPIAVASGAAEGKSGKEKTKTETIRDPVRAKSVELFKSIVEDEQLCEQIEEAIYSAYSSVSSEYRAKVRSKYLNLKQNTALHHQLTALKTLTAHKFVAMTATEMASAEQRQADREAAAKALRDTQAACDTEAETDQFKCGRCGKRKCKYYQLQTRSADEPMTTFVTCVHCGNRWKFS